MRISSASFLLLIAPACSGGDDAVPQDAVETGDQKIACAIGPGAGFRESCSLTRFERAGETIYRIDQPGGGFRLFTVATDGSGMVSYDGADRASNRLDGEMLEVTVGDERYRLPAKPDANK